MAEKWDKHAPTDLDAQLSALENPDHEESARKACPKILRSSRPGYDRTSLTNSRKVTIFSPFFQNPARAESPSGPAIGRFEMAPPGISMKSLPQTLDKFWLRMTHTVLPDPGDPIFES
jgi:hypothetical protein